MTKGIIICVSTSTIACISGVLLTTFLILYAQSNSYYLPITTTVNNCSLSSNICSNQECYTMTLNVTYENCTKILVSDLGVPVNTPSCKNLYSVTAYIYTEDVCDSLSLSPITHDVTYSSLAVVFGVLMGIDCLIMCVLGMASTRREPSREMP